MTICTTNFLSPVGFQVILARAPNLEFTSQRVSLPSVSANFANMPTPFTNLPFTPDKMEFDPLNITFIVAETMENYLEVFNWLKGIAFPKNFTQFKNLNDAEPMDKNTVMSDIAVNVLNSANVPTLSWKFKECFPISLSEMQFSTTETDIQYLECTATFKYAYFEIESLS